MNPPSYGHSPPLHHPVPQHVSTVPQLRSPPPPVPSQPQHTAYGNAYGQQQQPQQQAGATGNVFGQYGQIMNDPTAQVAAQFGQTAFKHGQEYLEQNVSCGSTRVWALSMMEGSFGGVTGLTGITGEPMVQLCDAQAVLPSHQFLCHQQTLHCALPLEA